MIVGRMFLRSRVGTTNNYRGHSRQRHWIAVQEVTRLRECQTNGRNESEGQSSIESGTGSESRGIRRYIKATILGWKTIRVMDWLRLNLLSYRPEDEAADARFYSSMSTSEQRLEELNQIVHAMQDDSPEEGRRNEP